MSCAICGAPTNKDDAPILAMGGFGNPRYVCDGCAHDLEIATESNDPAAIESAIDSLAEKISKSDTDDAVTINTLTDILRDAKSRREAILDGEFDAEDEAEQEDEVPDDIPEDLVETEEDKALDVADAVKNEKIQKILDVLTFGIIGAAVVALVIYFIFIR